MNLTVVIPTWKRVQKLRAALRSLEAQSSPPENVFVVFRREDEDTTRFLAEWIGSTPLRAQILQAPGPGVILAENEAINHILKSGDTDVVTFMDDDAVAFPDWIKKIRAHFQRDPRLLALGGPDIIVSEPETYHNVLVDRVGVITVFGKVIGNHHHRSQGVRNVDVLKGVNMSVAKRGLRLLDTALQGMDPAKGNGVFWELDLCLHLKGQGGNVVFDPDLTIQHDSNHQHFIPESVVASTAHNLAYVMLKHLPVWRKLLFIVYSILIGNGHVRGCLKTAYDVLRERRLTPLRLGWLSLRGFLHGFLTFLDQGKDHVEIRKGI